MADSTEPPPWMTREPLAQDVLDLRVLWQGTHWVTARAEVLALTDMSAQHLTNVVRMLQESAVAVQVRLDATVAAVLDMLAATSGSGETVETLTSRLLGTSIASVVAADYLETTPLIRAIRAELSGRAHESQR